MSNYILIPIASQPASGAASATSADQLVDAGQYLLSTFW